MIPRVKLSSVALVLLFLSIGVHTNVVKERIFAPGVHGDDAPSADKGGAYAFQTEVGKMLDILINSLYTNRSIFLREIISNASDALDKIHFLYLTATQTPKNDQGREPKMDIRIIPNKTTGILTVRDGGVGMTKDDLANNLGTLGASGTKNFLEKLTDGSTTDANLIGQFGVGFYSVFLVSERVRVASKHDNSDTQWVWESTGGASGNQQFFIYPDPRGNTLGRGTELTLEIKKDAQEEFLDEDNIRDMIHRYSEFIHFPIYLRSNSTDQGIVRKRKKELEKRRKKQQKGLKINIDDDDEEDEDEEDEDEAVNATGAEATDAAAGNITKTKKKKKHVVSELADEEGDENPTGELAWQRINQHDPLWTRKPSTISLKDYAKFYKSIARDFEDPMYHTHFQVEGEVDFKSVLYVPEKAPNLQMDNQTATNIRLYVRRVFITDEFKDLLPRYLSFVRGVVDSDDLPLNVSREQLQENRILKVIKKKLMRKTLNMFNEIAQRDKERLEEQEEKDAEEETRRAALIEEHGEEGAAEFLGNTTNATKKFKPLYPKFWENFGRNIRLGIIDDSAHRTRLGKLLRYKTSKSNGTMIPLEDYLGRMQKDQRFIFCALGESEKKLMQLPVVRDALSRDLEIVYMTDAIDEYVVQNLHDYDDKKLVDLTKEGIRFEDLSREEKKIEKKRKEYFEPFTKWYKDLLGDRVLKVMLSTRSNVREPVLVTSPSHGISANMARIMKNQPLSDKGNNATDAKQLVGLNIFHPLMEKIRHMVNATEESERELAADAAIALYETAALQSGFEIDDTDGYARRVLHMITEGMSVRVDAPLLKEDISKYSWDDEEDKKDDDYVWRDSEGRRPRRRKFGKNKKGESAEEKEETKPTDEEL